MKLEFFVEIDGVYRMFDVIVSSLQDLREPLRLLGAHLRQKAKTRFSSQGPGWPGLAASTQERLDSSYKGKMTAGGKVRSTARLRGILRKASPDIAAAVRSATASTGGGKLGAAIRNSSELGRGIRSQLKAVAKELDRAQARAGAGKKTRKGVRASKRHKLLGRLSGSLKARVTKGAVEVFSVVPWAGVHNAGGTNGRGAQIPSRTFLELEEEDLAVFQRLIAEHLEARAAGG